jgi:hypothetical protein
MKSFPPLNLFAAALLLVTVIPSLAGMQVDDCVVSGPLPNGILDDTPLNQWPEEVRYSSRSMNASPQIAGTILQNAPYITLDSDLSHTSRVVGQIFHIPPGDGDQVLEKIFITAQANLRNNMPMNFHARLVDLGESPDLAGYEAGTSLLEGSPEFEVFTPTERDYGQIISFTFTDKDRVRLKEGHWYSFELVSDPDNDKSSLIWLRSLGVSQEMPDCLVYRVPFAEETSVDDPRTAIENRQAFIGIKTSPAN